MKNKMKFLALAVLMVIAYSCFNDPIDTTDSINYTQQREDSIISMYIDTLVNRGFNVDTSSAGVYYVMLNEGEGDYPQAGDSIGIIYTGYFPESGYIFDQSAYWHQDSIWNYTYLSQNLIPGFDDAVGHLNKGAKGLFLLPSDLAYGSTGKGSIPPYSPLVFNIKLVDIYE